MARLQDIFTKNLRNLRRKCGLTQAELAEKVNVSTHHIGMIETSRNYPALELVERIANVLGIEVYELFIDTKFPGKELVRLRQEIREDMLQIFKEFMDKNHREKSRNIKTKSRVKSSKHKRPDMAVKSVKSGIPGKRKKRCR